MSVVYDHNFVRTFVTFLLVFELILQLIMVYTNNNSEQIWIGYYLKNVKWKKIYFYKQLVFKLE